jgi:hypothetical protein
MNTLPWIIVSPIKEFQFCFIVVNSLSYIQIM